MIAVTYTLELREPLLATSLDGDPNTKASHDYIPGSMIRGALIHLHLQGKRHQPIKTGAEPKDFTLKHSDEAEHRLFLSNTTRYLNAYPLVYPPVEAEVEDKPYRLVPLPRPFQIPKRESVNDGTIAHNMTAIKFQQPALQLTGVGEVFCLPAAHTLYVQSPDRQLAVHTARERRQGRATEADGAVFQYDALSPGQIFCGHILVNTGDDADTLMDFLNQTGELWLGGSRSAGYGHVLVSACRDDQWQHEVAGFPQTRSATETDDSNDEDYGDEDDECSSLADTDHGDEPSIEIDSAGRNGDLQVGEQFTITCLSHCLARDESGQLSMDVRHALAAVLHLSVTDLQPDLAHTHRSMTLVGGFNRTWGLPLPQLPAIAAGSVFTFTTQQPISAKVMQTIVDDGIGELRMDGLGRIALNWLPKAEYKIKLLESIAAPGTVPTIHLTNQPFAQRIGERILRRELDEALVEAVGKLPLHRDFLDRISKSQLSRLRTLLREQLGWLQQQPLDQISGSLEEDFVKKCLNPIIAYLDQLKRPAQKQWHAAKIGQSHQTRLSVWLRQCVDTCLEKEKSAWVADLRMPQPVKLGKVILPIPNLWRVEYTLRLIDGVLAQAAKQIDQANRKLGWEESDTSQGEVTA